MNNKNLLEILHSLSFNLKGGLVELTLDKELLNEIIDLVNNNIKTEEALSIMFNYYVDVSFDKPETIKLKNGKDKEIIDKKYAELLKEIIYGEQKNY